MKASLATLVPFSLCLGLALADSMAIYPQDTATRQVRSLDGVWNFRLQHPGKQEDGFAQRWFTKPLDSIDPHFERMPVPCSFNDITERREIRDFMGWSWYDRTFLVPSSWNQSNSVIMLRFGSVHYKASVYVNGQPVASHTGGHLPFEADVTKWIQFGGSVNRLTVAVNNEITPQTLPSGHIEVKNSSTPGQTVTELFPNFDFFPYSGIHRSVLLSLVPVERITDLTVVTNVSSSDGTTGVVKFEVVASSSKLTNISVELVDHLGAVVAKSTTGLKGELTVPKANLWWPFTSVPNGTTEGYLYTLVVNAYNAGGALADSINTRVGIRSLSLTKGQLLVNGKQVYLRGFGRHEDQTIRGRSLDPALIAKDFNLMKWSGANSFRTSHYPYSEAVMDEADAQGFLVIDEVPAVGLQTFTDDVILAQHLATVRALIERDKNRPSVAMWSIANEPVSDKPESGPYFMKVAAEARKLDPSQRPITGAVFKDVNHEHMTPSLDVLMINRYNGWYSDPGYPQVIRAQLTEELDQWHAKFGIPLMVAEYGADAVPGLHTEPNFVFSEDYQEEVLIEYHKVFDQARAKGIFVGEHIWNFADFATVQQYNRVGGNRKGVFTRDRQPKASARLLRCRYWRLSGDLANEHHHLGFGVCPEA